MSDTPTGETVTHSDSKTTETAQASVKDNASDLAEEHKKAAEQAQMRANQLENELKKIKEAEEARKAKELEEQNEWKTLAEQREAKLKEIEEQREAEQRQAELKSGTSEVFNEFSQEVVEIAKEAGMGLVDVTDEAKAELKAKLEKIQSRVVKDSTPTPNNPNTASAASTAEQLIEQLRYGSRQQKQEAKNSLIGSLEAVKQMKRMSGYRDQ